LGWPALSRRDLLWRLGCFGASGMALPRLREAERAQAATAVRSASRAKSCILLYLWGGPPQQDMWDMKPDAPVGIRSEFKPIATNVSGIEICDQLQQMAKHDD